MKREQKLFGLFDHQILSDRTGLLFGFPDRFSVPVLRWKSPNREDVAACASLEIVADSTESGPNLVVESDIFPNSEDVFPRRTIKATPYDRKEIPLPYNEA